MVRDFRFCKTHMTSSVWHLRETSKKTIKWINKKKPIGSTDKSITLCNLVATQDIDVEVPRGYYQKDKLKEMTCPKCFERMQKLLILR